MSLALSQLCGRRKAHSGGSCKPVRELVVTHYSGEVNSEGCALQSVAQGTYSTSWWIDQRSVLNKPSERFCCRLEGSGFL
jgi:hypothetical protein